jgi:hypothetical protein
MPFAAPFAFQRPCLAIAPTTGSPGAAGKGTLGFELPSRHEQTSKSWWTIAIPKCNRKQKTDDGTEARDEQVLVAKAAEYRTAMRRSSGAVQIITDLVENLIREPQAMHLLVARRADRSAARRALPVPAMAFRHL